MSKRSGVVLRILLSATVALTGCGIGAVDHTTGGGGASSLQGTVFGGQQPVVGATIQLYTVGSSGNASMATAMLTTPVYSVTGGGFDISGDYTCGKSSTDKTIPAGSSQVYIVATDGNPGLSADNPALVLLAALGPCSALPTTKFIEINEITTAAAAWALAPFMTSYTNVGATASNSAGITNAFLDAGLLADTETGLPASLPSNLTVETGKLYALANTIASCVNSIGGADCDPLFNAATPSGGTKPSDTLTAALNIVKHPGQNVKAVYQAAGKVTPFQSGLTEAPNDWTMSLSITGGGLVNPEAMAIDADSDVWVANLGGPLSAFGPQGAPLSSTGFGIGDIEGAYALAVDSLGNIWVDDYNATPYNARGGVTKFMGSNTSTPGTVVPNGSIPYYYDSSLYYSYAVAADTLGHIYMANNGNGLVTEYNSSGQLVQTLAGATTAFPLGIAIDDAGGFWLPDGDRKISHYTSANKLMHTQTCCSEANTVALDTYGNAWVANFGSDSVSEVAPDNTLLIDQASIGGIISPEYLAVDAASNVWVGNYGNKSITEVAANQDSVTAGTAISPSTGIYPTMTNPKGGYGWDAGLNEPVSIAPDQSGNVWVANQKVLKLVMFFGLATPTVTPIQPLPVAP